MLIDSHCHLDDSRFDDSQADLITAATQAGVSDYLVPATTISSWQVITDLAAQHKHIHAAYGLHPWFLDQHPADASTRLSHWFDNHQGVAVGECGLDFSRGDRDRQESLFLAQIKLAQFIELPLIIHAHKALDRVIQLLRNAPGTSGVVHRFSGSLEQAEQLINLGFFVGVAGGITFPAQARLRRVIAALPLERLLVETDAPDLPPATITETLNTPEYLPLTVKALAELQNRPWAQVARQTTINCTQLFDL